VDYTELLDLVKGSNETLEQINSQLETLSDPASLTTAVADASPDTTAGVEDQGQQPSFIQRQILARQVQMELRDVLRTKSTAQLHHLFGMQLAKRGTGIPFEMWAAQGGMAQAIYDGFRTGGGLVDSGLDLTRALDTGGAAALIRQDLEPFLYELYVREFVAFDRFVKEPANGLTHTFNQITSFGEAQFMSELGTVVDDTSVYERKTTNVAIVATRRGLSLKSQYAVAAGGMSYNPMDLELQGGLRAISARMQKQIFSGQSSNSGGSASTEDGEYQVNGFDGLRLILNTARAQNVDPTLSTPEDIKHALDLVVAEITQGGGPNPSILWANPLTKIEFDQQQDEKTRIIVPNQVDIGVGVRAQEINVLTGTVPFGLVKGNFISNYTTTNADGSFSGGENVRDIYALDEQTISLPFLGSEGPTVLDIPIGISGQLTHLFIIFGMWGLAVKAIPFSNKLRVKTA
jgi:hypothetical protein